MYNSVHSYIFLLDSGLCIALFSYIGYSLNIGFTLFGFNTYIGKVVLLVTLLKVTGIIKRPSCLREITCVDFSCIYLVLTIARKCL